MIITKKCYIALMVLKIIVYVWIVLKYGVVKRWINFAKNEVMHKPRGRGTTCIQYKEGREIGLVTFWVGTAF
jgi:hypothetical protein